MTADAAACMPACSPTVRRPPRWPLPRGASRMLYVVKGEVAPSTARRCTLAMRPIWTETAINWTRPKMPKCWCLTCKPDPPTTLKQGPTPPAARGWAKTRKESFMNALQNPLALLGQILVAWFFVIPGFGKLTGFAGAVGYAASAGMPMREVPWVWACVSKSWAVWPSCWAGARAMPRWHWLCSPWWRALSSTLLVGAGRRAHGDAVAVQQEHRHRGPGCWPLRAAFGGGGWSMDAKRANKHSSRHPFQGVVPLRVSMTLVKVGR